MVLTAISFRPFLAQGRSMIVDLEGDDRIVVMLGTQRAPCSGIQEQPMRAWVRRG